MLEYQGEVKKRSSHASFTLVELLIVVAIIAILAAVAVPNLMRAQIRAKVSAEKSNMDSIATALEAYWFEWSRYPVDRHYYDFSNPGLLT